MGSERAKARLGRISVLDDGRRIWRCVPVTESMNRTPTAIPAEQQRVSGCFMRTSYAVRAAVPKPLVPPRAIKAGCRFYPLDNCSLPGLDRSGLQISAAYYAFKRAPKNWLQFEGGPMPPPEVAVPVINGFLNEALGHVRR